jgi:hypothetical protein
MASAEISRHSHTFRALIAVRVHTSLTATPVILSAESSTCSSIGHAAAMRSTWLSVRFVCAMLKKASLDNLPSSSRIISCDNPWSPQLISSLVKVAEGDTSIILKMPDEGADTSIRRFLRLGRASQSFDRWSDNDSNSENGRNGNVVSLHVRTSSERGSLKLCSTRTPSKLRSSKHWAAEKSPSDRLNAKPLQCNFMRFGKSQHRPSFRG